MEAALEGLEKVRDGLAHQTIFSPEKFHRLPPFFQRRTAVVGTHQQALKRDSTAEKQQQGHKHHPPPQKFIVDAFAKYIKGYGLVLDLFHRMPDNHFAKGRIHLLQ